MVFRRLRKRGRDRTRSSERRRLGKAFQKDGPTTAKLLPWAVASLTLGTTRSPCSAERRDLRPGKDDRKIPHMHNKNQTKEVDRTHSKRRITVKNGTGNRRENARKKIKRKLDQDK